MNKYIAEWIGFVPSYRDVDYNSMYINANTLEEAEQIAEKEIQYNTSTISVSLVEDD